MANPDATGTAHACEEKERLENTYRIAEADYSRAFLLLSERTGVMTKPEYAKLHEFAEEALQRRLAARAALDRHTSEHGC
jgi:hypothetical protein